MLQLLPLLALAGTSLASYGANLNYRSPSNHHPGLGISVRKVVKRNDPSASYDPASLNFTHGVASGDPYPSSVILWTRCSPMLNNVDDNRTTTGYVPLYNPVPIYNDTDEGRPPSRSPICLNFVVATDEDLSDVVNQGTVYTSSDVDYTVKVEATGLDAFTYYYYRFTVCNSQNSSPIGRTKTTPAARDDVTSVGLAVFSCSNFPFGFFNAYGNPARKDSVDYVIHLGDYIYEYRNGDYGWGNAIDRISQPDREIYSLYDYRRRHATYKTDADLQLSQQTFPWIPVWDDHEVADNTYRDGSSELNNTEDSFIRDGGVSTDQRKMNAVRAYFEWMPIRQVDMDDNLRIWRSFQIGNLIDLLMLDTRVYDRSITDLYWNTDYIRQISNDASRSLMGSRQENWFYENLINSANRGATWRIIGSQIIFSRVNVSVLSGTDEPLNYDAWDGYQANRNRTLSVLYNNNISNNIFLAGDSHANWVSDLVWLGESPYDPATGAGSIGAEFAGTAVSSPSPFGQNITIARANNISDYLIRDNRELQWSEAYYRGYYELHVSKEQLNANFFGLPTIITRNPEEISMANFTVLNGGNRLERFDGSPAVGGVVENGAIKVGEVVRTNITNATDTGLYSVTQGSTFRDD
ncbi:hypothetical protein EPUS_03177 [Endocarpon pusillum Z07020]|uniref:Alkaline phosphatase D n=1 Tax=Endocarpon pusillum (strain Z07020 / HMAS-L-300199) TaxID=1263415 RepID=U1GR14_ENDPU|nr:uncharacterized protein EPUS_03177 [Endocarpon pusillum Z07020]ERF74793.1 hypothetical protein EPUS_03177 [Endocarpon pusillum Z07020]